MKPTERRMSMIQYLCYARHSKLEDLASIYKVSKRTIQRDILEISPFIPLDPRAGRYDGGIYVLSEYRMDRMYMTTDEIDLLCKIQAAIDSSSIIHLNDEEYSIFKTLIKTYTKPSK